jgi:hypothetical protein
LSFTHLYPVAMNHLFPSLASLVDLKQGLRYFWQNLKWSFSNMKSTSVSNQFSFVENTHVLGPHLWTVRTTSSCHGNVFVRARRSLLAVLPKHSSALSRSIMIHSSILFAYEMADA